MKLWNNLFDDTLHNSAKRFLRLWRIACVVMIQYRVSFEIDTSTNDNETWTIQVLVQHASAMLAKLLQNFHIFVLILLRFLAFVVLFYPHTRFPTAPSLICILQTFFFCSAQNAPFKSFPLQSSFRHYDDDDDRVGWTNNKKKLAEIGLTKQSRRRWCCPNREFTCKRHQIRFNHRIYLLALWKGVILQEMTLIWLEKEQEASIDNWI